MRDIGKNIKVLRTRKNMTQDDLAEKLFVTRQTVSNYENGKSRPDIDMLARMAEVLEADINTLIYGPAPKAVGKPAFQQLVVSGSCTLILGLLWLLSKAGYRTEYFNFQIGPMTFLHSFSQPFFFALLGWTLCQCVAVICKGKQPALPAGDYICPVLLAWGVLVIVSMLSLVVSYCVKLPRFIHLPLYYALKYSTSYPWTLLFIGIGLWLCGFPKRKKSPS